MERHCFFCGAKARQIRSIVSTISGSFSKFHFHGRADMKEGLERFFSRIPKKRGKAIIRCIIPVQTDENGAIQCDGAQACLECLKNASEIIMKEGHRNTVYTSSKAWATQIRDKCQVN